MTLRVNPLKVSLTDYLKSLQEKAISAHQHPIAPDAIVLDKAVDVMDLPGFNQGQVTVQDAAAQLPIELLELQPGQNVLDACAAPGGKTTHILQRQSQLVLTAVEMSPDRAIRIQQTLDRFELTCQLKVSLKRSPTVCWKNHLKPGILTCNW